MYEDGNKNMDSFSVALSGDNNKKERINTATNNADIVVVGSDAEKNTVVIHSMSNLGGNLLRPADNVVRAVRMGSTPIGMSIAIGSFCKPVKLSIPSLEKYQNCKSDDKLAALKGTNKGKINGSNIYVGTLHDQNLDQCKNN